MLRRNFLRVGAPAMILGCRSLSLILTKAKKLNVLVLGGTNFVGPAVVNAAVRAGHSVTLFNRGISNPQLFSSLELITGDREKGVEAYQPLTKFHWDVVIDVWPEKSYMVDEATRTLAGHADYYVFISSIAVYQNFQEVGINEESNVIDLPLDRSNWGYAEEKLASELHVQKRFENRHTILRPGPITGWRDPAFDLYYWCTKLRRGGEVIAPGSGMDFLQFIDVKDVGRFCTIAAERHHNSIYNMTGPEPELITWKDFLRKASGHLDSGTDLIWVDEDFLAQHNVRSFSDLPLWAPLSEDRGFMQISSKKLLATGFKLTPVEQTLDDCLQWSTESGRNDLKFGTETDGVGLDREKELKLLQQWKESQG